MQMYDVICHMVRTGCLHLGLFKVVINNGDERALTGVNLLVPV